MASRTVTVSPNSSPSAFRACVTARFERLVKNSGQPPIRLHDLRHGAASLTYRATKDLKAVQSLLGHSQISLTSDVYTSLFVDAEKAAAEAAVALVPRSAALSISGTRATFADR